MKELNITKLNLEVAQKIISSETGELLSRSYRENVIRTGKKFNSFMDGKSNITFSDIRQFLSMMKKEYTTKTFYIRMNALKTLILNQLFISQMDREEFFTFKKTLKDIFKLKGLVEINAIRKRSVKDFRPLSGDMLQQILNTAPERVRLIIKFMVMTGCHLREMISIKLKYVDICREHKDVVIIHIPSKYINERKVYILYNLIKEIINIYNGKTYLFETRNGTPLDRAYIKRELKKAGRNTKLKHQLAPALLRDTFIKNMKRCNYNSEQISYYLGEPGVTLSDKNQIGCEIVHRILSVSGD